MYAHPSPHRRHSFNYTVSLALDAVIVALEATNDPRRRLALADKKRRIERRAMPGGAR